MAQVLLFLAIFALVPHGESIDAPAIVGQYTVPPMDRNRLVMELTGEIANIKPHHHRSEVEYVPLSWVRFEGEQVKEGDPLIKFDTYVVDLYATEAAAKKNVAEANLAVTLSKDKEKLSDLQLSKETLTAQRRVLIEQLAATRVKDDAKRGLLLLQLEQARTELDAAARHLERVKPLQSAGILASNVLQAAEDRYLRAQQGTRLPDLQLDQHDGETGAILREGLALDLRALELDLGNELNAEGVFGAIDSLKKLRDLQANIKTAEIRAEARKLGKFDRMKAHSVLVAESEGVMAYNPNTMYRLEVGSKHPLQTLAFILNPGDCVVDLFIPEDFRQIIGAVNDSNGVRATIRLPALPGRIYAATLRAIGTVPTEEPITGLRGFRSVAHLEGDLQPLKSGLGIRATVALEPNPDWVLIPLWYIADPLRPEITRADGARSRIQGFILGEHFVVTRGLRPGDVLRLPDGDAPSPRKRLTGTLAPRNPFMLRWGLSGLWSRQGPSWVVAELVPDGATVRQGDILAKLIPRQGNIEDFTYQLAFTKTELETKRAISELESENSLVEAFVRWKKSEIAVQQARLKYRVTRYSSLEAAQVQADVNRELAMLDVKRADSTAADVVADTSGFVSEHGRRDAQLKRELAHIASKKAELGRIAALRQRDWLKVQEDGEALATAQLMAYADRVGYTIARGKYRVSMVNLSVTFNKDKGNLEEQTRVIAGSTLYAPRSGRVFYYQAAGQTVGIGRDVTRMEPMLMPTDAVWQCEFEAPSQMYGRWREGQTLPLVIPAFGTAPRPGHIRWISPYFEPAATEAEDRMLRGSMSIGEPVFHVCVEFELPSEEAARATPGLTAYVDI